MQLLKYAISFIRASFKLASKKPQLRKSLLSLRAGSLVMLFAGFISIALVAWLIGLSPLGLILIGVLSFLVAAGLFIWAEISSLDICPEAAKLFQDNAQGFSPPEKPVANHWGDILILSLSTPGTIIINNLRKLLGRTAQIPGWFDAQFLILPIISLEGLDLSQAVERVNQMVEDNLLRIQPNLVRVRLVARVVRDTLLIIGILLGAFIAVSITDPATAGPWQRVLAAGAGLLSAWLFTTIGNMFGAFTRACYLTSLYIWVRNVERSREGKTSDKSSPPEILRQVLGSVK